MYFWSILSAAIKNILQFETDILYFTEVLTW